MSDYMMHEQREHSPWWPLKWIYLSLMAIATGAAATQGDLYADEWGPLPLVAVSLPLLAIAVRDLTLILRMAEAPLERGWRLASLLFSSGCIAVLLRCFW